MNTMVEGLGIDGTSRGEGGGEGGLGDVLVSMSVGVGWG